MGNRPPSSGSAPARSPPASCSAAALKRDRACDFLTTFLKNAPRTSRNIWTAVQEQGIAEHTLRNARKKWHLHRRRVWRDGVQHHYWLLPEQQLREDAVD